ncbi:hypothetical protein KJ068_16690 [bacterium]|nr:MAG: hypothetical protein EDS67_09535 [candidate division KSB1 bacterium]MCE7943935.1 hypothetical protein [Chlorobi bacterium CHB1]MCL4706809.1 hypothetical protein [bacterium]MDL1878417.1 hypothetical protein [Cytophagia bacterium CHB2]MBC6948390.1 hypothetical protein [candidate division KSB1 bacterium]
MTFQTITLNIPARVYQRVQRAAEAVQSPIEKVIVETLDTALPSLDDVPPEMVDELAGMSTLSVKSLWQAARSIMSAKQQARLRRLTALQRERPLKPAEVRQLDGLVNEYARVTLRKAHAYALLHKRGLYSAAHSK